MCSVVSCLAHSVYFQVFVFFFFYFGFLGLLFVLFFGGSVIIAAKRWFELAECVREGENVHPPPSPSGRLRRLLTLLLLLDGLLGGEGVVDLGLDLLQLGLVE